MCARKENEGVFATAKWLLQIHRLDVLYTAVVGAQQQTKMSLVLLTTFFRMRKLISCLKIVCNDLFTIRRTREYFCQPNYLYVEGLFSYRINFPEVVLVVAAAAAANFLNSVHFVEVLVMLNLYKYFIWKIVYKLEEKRFCCGLWREKN